MAIHHSNHKSVYEVDLFSPDSSHMFHLRHAIACKFRKGNHLRQECNNKQYIANHNHAIYNNKTQEHRKAKSKFTNISKLHYAICCQTQMVPREHTDKEASIEWSY